MENFKVLFAKSHANKKMEWNKMTLYVYMCVCKYMSVCGCVWSPNYTQKLKVLSGKCQEHCNASFSTPRGGMEGKKRANRKTQLRWENAAATINDNENNNNNTFIYYLKYFLCNLSRILLVLMLLLFVFHYNFSYCNGMESRVELLVVVRLA